MPTLERIYIPALEHAVSTVYMPALHFRLQYRINSWTQGEHL